MPLSTEDSLLVVCLAFARFVTPPPLSKRPDGSPMPALGAALIPLTPITTRLATLDEQYNQHSIMDILHQMQKDCYDRGYDLAIGGADLLGPTAARTFGELAALVEGSSPI